jgi:hypothetical protein
MQYLAAMFIGTLGAAMASLVGRALLALGIGFVTYAGFSTSLDWIKAKIIADTTSLSSHAVGFLAFMKVDQALSMIFSAVAVSMILRGVTSSGITKMRFKAPA